MCKCPKCGRYMSSYLENIFGNTRVIWSCICGYSNKQDSYTVTDNKSYVVKNPEIVTTYHT